VDRSVGASRGAVIPKDVGARCESARFGLSTVGTRHLLSVAPHDAVSAPSEEGGTRYESCVANRDGPVTLAPRGGHSVGLFAPSEEGGASAVRMWIRGPHVGAAVAWAPTHRPLCALGSGSTRAFYLPPSNEFDGFATASLCRGDLTLSVSRHRTGPD
jgi:hypothetical protein